MASVRVALYTSKVLKNGEHPIVIQLIKDRKVKKMTIGSCLPQLWDFKRQLPKLKHPQFRELELLIEKKKSEAKAMLLTLEYEKNNFSLDDFENKFQAKSKSKTVFNFLDEVFKELIEAKKIGNAKVYKDLKRILTRFRNGKDLNFGDIDESFLKKLEQDCRTRGMGEVAMSTYFRTLRALFNRAILEKYAKQTEYPFLNFKVSKFSTKTTRRAIHSDEMQKIIDLPISNDSNLYDAKQFFIFSYLAWGINFADMARLKWSDINEGFLNYTRLKNERKYSIKLLPEAICILEYYKVFRSDDYIFPILYKERHQTPIAIFNRTKKVNRQINIDLKEIAAMAKIETNLTFYVARHTFATTLKRKGASTPIIGEMLGHGLERTTQIYLGGFENNVLFDASRLLVD